MRVLDNLENYDIPSGFHLTAEQEEQLAADLKEIVLALIPLRSSKLKTRQYFNSHLRYTSNTQNDTDNPHELLVLKRPVKARFIRLTGTSTLIGKLSMYDLRVFGLAEGETPDPVDEFVMDRREDERRIHLSWQPAENAQGYVLHWGTDPEELYNACQTLETEIELGLFSTGQSYFFRVDSFNESGVTSGATQALYSNSALYYLDDRLHMNEAGYRKIGPVQAAFLSNGK